MKRIIFKKEDLTQLPIPEVGYKTLGMNLDGTLSYIDDLGDITPIIGTNSGGITNLADDTTPELGGNLDLNNFNIGGTGSIDIEGNVIADMIQLKGGVGTQGEMSWNVDEETIQLVMDGTTQHIGQDTYIHARNNTVSTILKGTAVRATGSIGASGRITIAPMVADGSIPARYFIGLAAEDITAGADGQVITFGKIRQINLTDFNDGDVLWLDPTIAGGLTASIPTAPNLKIATAFVIHAASNGTLFIRVENGTDLHNDQRVEVSGLTDGDFLLWDNVTQRWENNSLSASIDNAGAVMNTDVTTASMSFVIDEDNMISNSDTKIPTQQSVKAYVDNRVASSVTYQGGYNATTSPNSSALKGYMYTVTVAGSGSGYWSSSLEIGDVIIAEIDNPSSQTDWTVVNKDLNAASIKTSYESNSDTNAFTDAEKTKLAGIEANATADQTASEILTAIKTVDGSGSGLDADLLDGFHASSFALSGHTHSSSDITNLSHFATVYDSTSLLTALADSNIETILVADNILISTATSLTINSNNTKLIFGNQIEFRSTGLPWDTVNITWNDTTVTDDTLIKSEIFFSTISSFIVNNSQGFNMKNVLTSDNISFVKNTGQDIKYEKGNLISGDAIKEYWDNTFVISNDAVTNAKLSNMTQNTIKGRITASTGDPEDLTAANVISIISTADGTGSGLDADLLDGQQGSYYLSRSNHTGTQLSSTISDFDSAVSNNVSVIANTAKVSNATHTGDVTGSTSLTISNGVVTNAKLSNMTQNTIKGRITDSTGDPEDLTAANVISIISTADGAGSGLDADLLDGQQGSFYQAASTAITKSTAVFSKTITIESPTSAENMTIFRTDVAITVVEVIAVSRGTSPSTTYQLRHGTDRSAVGNNLTTSAATTSTTTGNVATLSTPSIAADSWIWLVTTAASGTGVSLSIDIRYTIN